MADYGYVISPKRAPKQARSPGRVSGVDVMGDAEDAPSLTRLPHWGESASDDTTHRAALRLLPCEAPTREQVRRL